jgi:hypothetical protein
MMVHSCNPSTSEAEAEGSRVQGHPELHTETSNQKNKKDKPLLGSSNYKQDIWAGDIVQWLNICLASTQLWV